MCFDIFSAQAKRVLPKILIEIIEEKHEKAELEKLADLEDLFK